MNQNINSFSKTKTDSLKWLLLNFKLGLETFVGQSVDVVFLKLQAPNPMFSSPYSIHNYLPNEGVYNNYIVVCILKPPNHHNRQLSCANCFVAVTEHLAGVTSGQTSLPRQDVKLTGTPYSSSFNPSPQAIENVQAWIALIQNILHRHAQRCVSLMAVNPVMLTRWTTTHPNIKQPY